MRKLRLVVFIWEVPTRYLSPSPGPQGLTLATFQDCVAIDAFHCAIQPPAGCNQEKPSNVCHNYPKRTSDRQRPQMKNAFASLMFPTVPSPSCSLLSIVISIIVIIVATLLFNWQLVLPIALVVSVVAASRLNANQTDWFPMRGEGR